MAHPLSQRIADVLDLDPDAGAIQFDGQWSCWGQIAALAGHIEKITGPARVGIMLRNHPVHVAALLGVLAAGGTVVVINPHAGTTGPAPTSRRWRCRSWWAWPRTSPI